MEVMDTHSVMSKQSCYCGPPGITIGDLLRKTSSPIFGKQGDRRHVYYTHKGRCGLGQLCLHWKLTAGDEILMPAYNCGSEVDPFICYGLSVVFYKVDRNATIDISDILQRTTHRTKVIYITHYFGWPQDIKVLSEYCRKNKIRLIEDCALSLFSNPVSLPIGILGDAAIYSFPKTLPVPDGGALMVSKDDPLREEPAKSPPMGVIVKELLPFVKRASLRLSDSIRLYNFLTAKWIQRKNNRSRAIPKTSAGLSEMPKSYYYDKGIENLTASKLTRYILCRTCLESVVRQRRNNYSLLYEAVEKSGLFKPLYRELPDGVCPLFLPVLVGNRESVCVRLNRIGISTGQWWAGFHRAFDWSEFPDAKYLKEHILALPIHQQLKSRNVNYISTTLKKLNDLAGIER
jgi:perosamine synthetase